MYVRSIKAINTTVGKTNYAIAVPGSPYAISDIKAALIECGMMEVEVAFVHLKDLQMVIKLMIHNIIIILYLIYCFHSIYGACIHR